jgi:pentatricopeptide repeat protein
MFLHRLKPILARRCLLNRQTIATRKCNYLPPLQQHITTTTRFLHVQSHVTIPDTKEAEAIVPLLQQIDTEKPSATIYNSILKTLALEGRSEQAQKLYDVVFRHHDVKADIETYSQLMLAYMNDGKYEESMEIYYELRDHDEDPTKNLRLMPDTYAAMLKALTDPSKIQENHIQFDKNVEPIYEYSVEDADSAIYPDVDGNSQPALLTALALFKDMRHLEIQPTPDMYENLLKACADQKDGYVLEKLHKLIRMDHYFDPDVDVFNQLMRAYHAVGDPASVLEIYEVAESSNVVDQKSLSTVLETCLQNGFHSRAEAIWNSLEYKNNIKITANDFNIYLQCLLNSNDTDKAEKMIQEGLTSGQANEASVNILKKYTNTTANK